MWICVNIFVISKAETIATVVEGVDSQLTLTVQ